MSAAAMDTWPARSARAGRARRASWTTCSRAPARRARRRAAARDLLAQGLHPAHRALPRRLPLLHVRPASAARRARLPDRRGGARGRRAGAAAGCREALFTLGDRPELRYRAAREELAELGFASTAAYLAHVAGAVLDETGLLPHANPGILDGRRPARAARGLRVAGDHARDRSAGSRSAAGRTSARRTSCRPSGSTRSRGPAGCASRTRAAS